MSASRRLFNALARQKKAIVDSFPGLTRDILSVTVTHNSASFTLSDTPGLDIKDSSELVACDSREREKLS